MRLQHATRGREHVDHRARAARVIAGGGNDVAFGIETHAVDAAMHAARILAPGEQRVIRAEAAVFLDRVRAQLAGYAQGCAALGDIECSLVAGNQNAIGLRGVEGDARDRIRTVFLRVGAQHGTVFEVGDLGLVPVAVIDGIGKPDAAFAIDREIVRRVEPLAVDAIGDHRRLAIRIEAHDRAAARAATEQSPLVVECETVGTIGARAPFFYRVGLGVVSQDAALADLGEIDVLAIPYRTFGNQLFRVRLHQQLEFPGHVIFPVEAH